MAACRETGAREIRIIVNGEEYDPSLRMIPADLPCCLKPMEQWHANIEHDDIRLKLCGGNEQRSAVADGAHDLEFAFQHGRSRRENGFVIVG